MANKSQLQIGETIAVLFVFFILVVIGFIFYANIIKSDLQLKQDDQSQARSVQIAQRTMHLPELECSHYTNIVYDCVDILKLNSAKDVMMDNELYYYDMFEFSEINLTEVYPDTGSKWTIYSRKLPEFSKRFLTNVPVSLYDPRTGRNSIAVLSIDTTTK